MPETWPQKIVRLMQEEQTMSDHKRYAPSGAEIWMNCAGALNLIDLLDMEGRIDWSGNEYANYGTVAHEIAAVCLNEGTDAWEYQGEERESEGFTFEVDQEMTDLIQHYLDTVREDLKKYGGTLHVEHKEVLDHVDPECGGTLDAGFLGADDVARIYDLKSGFVYVDEEYNKQEMIYALEFLLKVLNKKQQKAVKGVELIIVQSRAFGAAPVRRFEMPVEELLKWQDETLVPAIAATKAADAPLSFGSWCTKSYCKAVGSCPLANEKAAEVIEKAQIQAVDRLDPDACGEVLELKPVVSAFLKAVEARSYQFLLKNKPVPGQKLVRAIKQRAWKSGADDSVPNDLEDEGFTRKIKTPAQFEKLGPKAKEFVAEWAHKPDGGLTIAAADDKRPAESAPTEDPDKAFSHLIS